jgi:hypothetical protein
VPWCNTCDRFYNPNSLKVDGTCPTCGHTVAEPAVESTSTESASTEAASTEATGAPWHFKVLIAVTAVYLGYRLFQGILWVAHQL